MGFKKYIRGVVFPAQPKDLPSALTLAREVEASIERSMFANFYAKAVKDRVQTSGNGKSSFHCRQGKASKDEQGQDRNPHFVRRTLRTNNDNQVQAPQLVLQV